MHWVRHALYLTTAAVALSTAIGVALQGHALKTSLVRADPDLIQHNGRQLQEAIHLGRPIYLERCAACHGKTGLGDQRLGVPNLTDATHLYGSGRVSDIEHVVRHGIRSGDSRGWHSASMPAYATAKPYESEPIPPLTPAELGDVAWYVLTLTGEAVNGAAVARGKTLFENKGGCYDCHEPTGRGDSAIGAPNLTDRVWLYDSGAYDDIVQTLQHGRAGYCPAFGQVLSALEIRSVAVFAASLQRGRK